MCAAGVPLAVNLYPFVVMRFSPSNSAGVNWQAMFALSQIAVKLDGAQAIVDAEVLDDVLVLLESPSPEVRLWTCVLVGSLASHDSIAPAILELKPYKQLLSLLG